MDAQHLENMMLSERSERKDYNMRFHLCLMSRTAKSIETEGTFVIAGGQGPGMGDERQLFSGYQVSHWSDKNILELNRNGSCTIL